MSEEKEQLVRAYRRASLGLGIAALLWTAAFLLISRDEPTNTLRHWLIPIGAAALSVFCWALYAKAKNE